MQEVPISSLGYLPKKMETQKKAIKVMSKVEEGKNKLKEFELDRILYTRESLLHYFNAQMVIHAQAFNSFSFLFDICAEIDDV